MSGMIHEIAIQSGEYVVVILLVFLLSRMLRFELRGCSFDNPKKSALVALAGIFASMAIIASVGMLLMIASQQSPGSPQTAPRIYDVRSVVNQGIFCFLMILPVLIIKKMRKESWESMGVSRRNLSKAVVLGLILAAAGMLTLFLLSGSASGVLSSLSISHIWALLLFSTVGFAEEFMFRGYLQTRMIAWLGLWQGWVLSSLIHAFGHFFQRIGVMGMSPTDAVISCVTLIPLSLSMGFVMMRSENFVAPAIYHTFADWWGTL